MDLFVVFGAGIALSMDAFAISLATGISRRELPFRFALRQALIFGFFQALMPFLGFMAATRFADTIRAFDHFIAFFLLSVIGGRMILGALRESGDESAMPRAAAGIGTTLLLAVATSIDALATGVGFAFAGISHGGLSILSASLLIGCTTFLICLPGMHIGRLFGLRMKKSAEIFGGILLVSIGTKILVEHLFF